jgi:tRNA threonylcarbamoyladenosine biosynthesis protein TsaB
MYFILCIETATEICSVAVVNANEIVSLVENTEGNMHASMLTGLIAEAVEQAGISLQQLDAIAVSKGPGSYTGLRVGVSTVKGLCYALDKPLIAIPTLQSLAAVGSEKLLAQGPQSTVHGPQLGEDGSAADNTADRGLRTADFSANRILIPMIDARRMEVYCSGYDATGNQVRETEAKIIDVQSFEEELTQGPVYFMGNGSAKCKDTLNHPNAIFVGDVFCSAKGMFSLVRTAFESKQFEDVAYFEPYYLKDFMATIPKKRV